MDPHPVLALNFFSSYDRLSWSPISLLFLHTYTQGLMTLWEFWRLCSGRDQLHFITVETEAHRGEEHFAHHSASKCQGDTCDRWHFGSLLRPSEKKALNMVWSSVMACRLEWAKVWKQKSIKMEPKPQGLFEVKVKGTLFRKWEYSFSDKREKKTMKSMMKVICLSNSLAFIETIRSWIFIHH